MIKTRKGVSAVVATVLLILITVLAVSLIAGFIIPMVRESLEGGISCFELIEYFKIVEDSEYTCYTATETKLMVERSMEEYEVKGFAVSILTEGQSKRYDVYTGTTQGGISMLGGGAIEIPEPGEARTYVFDTGNGRGVRISVLQKDDSVCEPEFYDVPDCII